MKIYTKKGDSGETLGANYQRVSKSDIVIDLFGYIDKAQSTIGLLYETIKIENNQFSFEKEFVLNQLEKIMPYFYQVSSTIYLNKNMAAKDFDLELEKWIDEYDLKLPKLSDFILPIGSMSSSIAHMARVDVRTLERKFVAWEKDQNFTDIKKFLNRLSDYFFVLARILSHDEKLTKLI